MKRLLIFILIWTSLGWGQSSSLGIIPIPIPIPTWGGYLGAGTVVTPTDFGLPICRLTDANTEFSLDGTHQGGVFSVTSSGSNVDHRWNANHTLIAVQRNGAANSLVLSVSFTGSTCTVSTKYQITSGSVAFSAVQPLIAYDVETASIYKYDFGVGGGCTLTAPCKTLIHNFAIGTCLSGMTATWNSVFLQSHGDTFFGLGFSASQGAAPHGQGTGSIVATYLIGSGERVLNTGTTSVLGIAPSSVCGDYGPVGLINMIGSNCPGAGTTTCGTCTGGVACPDEFNIHEVYSSPNETTPWLVFDYTASTCANCGSDGGDYVWLPAGLNVTAPSYGGHYAVGYHSILANTNSPLSQYAIFQAVSAGALVWPITKFQVVSSSAPDNLPTIGLGGLDAHPSWQNVDANDTNSPFLTNTSYRTDAGDIVNNYAASGEPPTAMPGIQCSGIPCAPTTNPFPGPLINEVESLSLTNPPGSGIPCAANPCTTLPITRLAHTFNDTVSFLFDASQATGAVSPDGAAYAWTTTAFCGVGDNANDSNGICGGPTWVKSNTYVVGNLISPLTANAGNYTYKVVSCAGTCTSAATHPVWTQTTGANVTDNTITWQSVGPQTFREDVLAVLVVPSSLPKQFPAPPLQIIAELLPWLKEYGL